MSGGEKTNSSVLRKHDVWLLALCINLLPLKSNTQSVQERQQVLHFGAAVLITFRSISGLVNNTQRVCTFRTDCLICFSFPFSLFQSLSPGCVLISMTKEHKCFICECVCVCVSRPQAACCLDFMPVRCTHLDRVMLICHPAFGLYSLPGHVCACHSVFPLQGEERMRDGAITCGQTRH